MLSSWVEWRKRLRERQGEGKVGYCGALSSVSRGGFGWVSVMVVLGGGKSEGRKAGRCRMRLDVDRHETKMSRSLVMSRLVLKVKYG